MARWNHAICSASAASGPLPSETLLSALYISMRYQGGVLDDRFVHSGLDLHLMFPQQWMFWMTALFTADWTEKRVDETF